jgi:RecA-family ATPase
MILHPSSATAFGGAHQLRQFIDFVRCSPAEGRSRDEVHEAADTLTCWPAPTLPGAPVRPAAARAARIVGELMDHEYRERARDVLRAAAPALLAETNSDPITAAKLAMKRHHLIADPTDVAETFGLIWAHGFLETVQRAIASGEAEWASLADQEEAALRFELDGYAHLVAERAAPDILRDLPEGTDFAEALLATYPLVTPSITADVAEQTIRRLAEPPKRQYFSAPIDPFASRWEEPSEAAIALSEKAKAMLSFQKEDTTGASEPAAEGHTGLDLNDPNNWDNPDNMPAHIRPVEPLGSLDLAALSHIDPQPKSFAIERIAPAGEVTLFTGPGSAGKSLLGQQFATAAASGNPCIGLMVKPGRAIYLTCEDDNDQLHWRQQHLCQALGVPMASLAGKLHLISLRGELDNALMVDQGKGKLAPSAAYRRIAATIKATGSHMIFLDNVAHLFVGNENDRGEVTRFVNLLNRLAGDTGAAIVLLAHTNKQGDNFSGSTAWLNAVRSQCFITHDEETDLRTLSLPKSNYDRKGDVATFRWHNWAFVRDADIPIDQRAEIAGAIAANAADAAFLACLKVRNAQGEGRGVGPSPGPNYAPAQFEGMSEAKRYRKQVLKQAMDRLFAAGKIRTETVRNQTKGRDVRVIVEVPEAA